MKGKRRNRAAVLFLLLCFSMFFLNSCGEKKTFQVNELEPLYTNVKLASVGAEDIVLDEEKTKLCMAVFDGLTFKQTQSGGKFTDKSFSLVFLDGEKAVDSMQVCEDGRTIFYGGFFYQLEEENYDIEFLLQCFEEQKEPETDVAEAAPEESENTLPAPEQETTPEESSDTELTAADFERQKVWEISAVGYECKIDLDGDGKKESILYEVQGDGSDGESGEVLFIVRTDIEDGEGRLVTDWKNNDQAPLSMFCSPATEGYYIVDLDSTDSSYEIALLDYGPSGDPEFYFVRYEEGKLVYLGSVPTDWSDKSLELDVKGDGKVTCSGRLSILQTWNAPFVWELEEGKFKQIEEEWYYPYVNANSQQSIKQLQPVTVYAEADLKAENTVVEPTEDIVTFGTTDNKNWVQFFRTDGISGWIYLEDGGGMMINGESVPAHDVFSDLNFAG